jgi:glycine/sarcosine/dimethylglycine N-methyltransferase
MPTLLPNDSYRKEYNRGFVSVWDDLIGWDGRAAGEARFFQRLLDAYGARKVADIACGTGFHAINLAKDGFEVTAADGAETMVRQTEANAKEHGVELADLRVADWLRLAEVLGEERFDAVVCLGNAFTHLFEHEARRDALEQIFAVLRPGGLAIIDHRNYDTILDKGFRSKHRYYYTGQGVDARPVEITRTRVKFLYQFPDGQQHTLTLYPLRQDYMGHLFEDAGFMDVFRFGDFERPYEHYEPDFIQQVAFKPRQVTPRAVDGGGETEDLDRSARREQRDRIVQVTKDYYDGAANQIYRDIWGENIHLGLFSSPRESLRLAMARSNERIASDIGLGDEHEVLDVGCGFGALARYLAQEHGCRVTATNIAERELQWGRELTRRAGLADKVALEWADYHELPYDEASFDYYFSQEAFLHAADKPLVLSEAHRVLRPDGKLVFTDILVRKGTPEAIQERIHERLKTSDIWDASDYRKALSELGFTIEVEEDWSENVAPTYAWVRKELERRRDEFEQRIGKQLVDRTSAALQFWVDAANDGHIGWAYFVARK